MKSTKFLILILFFEFLFVNLNAQISGGNTVSSFVCSNRKVYTWGNNKTTLGTGLLGCTGCTADYYTSMQPVTFPGGEDISQVSSASGSHYMALDCNGNVWGWGNNSLGQVGNGLVAGLDGFVTTPTRVLAIPEIEATYKDASSQLINVAKVYAGNNSSFAILTNGDLVSWGSNGKGFNGSGYDDAYGQLGNGILPGLGTTATQTSAGYVKVPGGGKLTGVIQVFTSDNTAYALCDPDGDGVGTVYSWGDGKSGMLGRNALGTSNPFSGAEVKDAWARTVRYADGTIMNNITQISSGDVFCAALDVNGYIWTWGNGGWNNSTGNTVANYTGSDPRRVLKGSTTGASNDGTYLLAKQIGAGQGYGMAVTMDNKPVAWGGGGYADGGGFSGGSATGTEYITYTGTSVHNDVINIYRGDTWGYYQRADGTMWTWGRNVEGQLGIGGSVSNELLQATKINPPTGCGFSDPKPFVNVSPKSLTVCSSSFTGVVLNAGFVISASLAPSYSIQWAKDGAIVSSGTVLSKGVAYTATSPGTYTVTISYIGSNAGCDLYNPASETIVISPYPNSYLVPANLTYCGDSVDVKVTSILSTNAKYNWYNTASSTTIIGSSYGNNSVRVPILGAIPGTGSGKIMYVEESAYASGTILKKSEGCAASWFTQQFLLNNGAIDIDNAFATGYTVYEPITISELSCMFSSTIYSIGDEGTASITFAIYGYKFGNGYTADDTKLQGTLVANYTRTRGATEAQDLIVQLTAKGNVVLQPGIYFIGPSNYAFTGNISNPKLGRGNCALPTGIVDDVNGTIIKQNVGVCGYGNPAQTSTGHDFDVKFTTAQHFCDRLPVTIFEACTCASINNVIISSTDSDLTLCPSGTTVLSSNSQINSTDFDFTWYKGDNVTGTIVFGPIANIASSTYTVTDSNPGLYTLLVRDKLQPTNELCHKKASITINSAPLPTVTITGGGTFEVGNVTSPITVNITGTPPFMLAYNPGGVIANLYTTDAYTIPTPIAAGTYEYQITSFADRYCYGVAPANTAVLELTPQIPVLINTISIPTTLDLIVGNTAILSPIILPANATDKTVTWTSSNSSVVSVNPNGVVTGVAVGSAIITVASSVDPTKTATCIVSVSPRLVSSITITPSTASLFVGENFTLTATVLPVNATETSITWTSSNPTVAVVSSDGVIIALSVGIATITATANDGSGVFATCLVTVSAILVESITVTPSTANLHVLETVTIQTVVLPPNAGPITIIWSSSNPTVAIVDNQGIVTAMGIGTAIITATVLEYGNISDEVIINVTPKLVSEISIVPSSITLDPQDVEPLVAIIFPSDATNKAIVWSSSNTSVALVNSQGIVTAINEGEAIISATALDGSTEFGTCEVTVNPSSIAPCTQLQVFANTSNLHCNGEETGSIELLVTGGVAPYSYKWSNTSTDATLQNVGAGVYSVIITDDEGCSVVRNYTLTEPQEIEVTPTIVFPACGLSNGTISLQVTGGSLPYTYEWDNQATTSSLSNLGAGNYSVTITDNNGCEVEETVQVSNDGAPEITVESITESSCNASTGSVFLSVSGGTEPYTYEWNDAITTEDRTNIEPGIYSITVTDNSGCIAVIDAEVPSTTLLQPSISLVTVSSETGKNLVVWQKEQTDLIDFYTIYRENTVAGQYDEIGTSPYSTSSIYEDITADSEIRSWRYKISATDVCGNETELSTEHKTIHLQKNLGLNNVINLDWDGYEGIYFSTYSVYKINSLGETELITQLPSSITRYTYSDSPTDAVSYVVGIELPEEIDENEMLLKIESGPFSLALSNIAEVETDIQDMLNEIHVYPTVTNNVVNIDLNSITEIKVTCISSSGEVIFTKIIKDKTIQIPVKQYSKGTYVLQVEFDDKIIQKEIIIK